MDGVPDVSREEELMEFLERFGKFSLKEADDVDIYSLSNSEGTVVWHFDPEDKSTLENLERMELQLKNILFGHCEKIEENHK